MKWTLARLSGTSRLWFARDSSSRPTSSTMVRVRWWEQSRLRRGSTDCGATWDCRPERLVWITIRTLGAIKFG